MATGVFPATILTVFISVPIIAVVPAGLMFLMSRSPRATCTSKGRRARVNLALVAAISWLLFVPYEYAMLVWSRSVVAPIRLDLVIVGLIIAGLSAGAIDRAVGARPGGNSVGPNPGEDSTGAV